MRSPQPFWRVSWQIPTGVDDEYADIEERYWEEYACYRTEKEAFKKAREVISTVYLFWEGVDVEYCEWQLYDEDNPHGGWFNETVKHYRYFGNDVMECVR